MLVSLRLDTRWEKFWNIAKLDSFWKASIRWHSAKILGSSPQSSLPCRSARQNMPQNYAKKKQFSPRDIHRICANERQGHQCHCSASQALLGLNVVSHHQRFHDYWPSQRDPIILKCFRHGWPMPSLELQSYSHPHRFPSDHAWKDFRMPTLPLIPATRCARNEVTAIAAIAQRCAHLTSNCFYPLWDHCVGLCRTRLIQNEMKK